VAESVPLPLPEDRGHLDVRLKVVTRVVEQTLARTPGVAGRSSSLGSQIGRLTGGELPRADVRVVGRSLHVKAEVGALWPAPVADLATRAREAVVRETERIVGLPVKKADVVVHVLTHDQSDSPGRSRVQ
jgi:uncharacterized alkaline shock family protein YloU